MNSNSPPPDAFDATAAAQGIPPGFVPVESKLDGIKVYAPAPHSTREQPDARNFKCPNCGATTAFDPRAGSVTCSNCGSVYTIRAEQVGRRADEFEFTLDTLKQAHEFAFTEPQILRGWGSTRRDLHCASCGANISVAPTELSTTCPFCGSNRVAARTAVPDTFRPRFMIPFKTERNACSGLAKEWLARGWMYPGDLVQAARSAEFTGIYLPFWTFGAELQSQWRAQVGYERQESYFDVDDKTFKSRTVIDWKWQDGRVNLPFENELGTGTRHISDSLLKRLAPYDLDALVTYEPGYLAGWRATSYEIPLEEAWDAARARMREKSRDACYKDIPSSHVRDFSMNAKFERETWRLILLPVFITTYQFQAKTYQLVVNGQTGKVAGNKPVAWTKIWLIVAALVTPGLALSALGILFAVLGAAPLFFFGGFVFMVGASIAVWVITQAMQGGEA